MDSMTLARIDVVVGVDTHKQEHVAAALDGLGGRLGELTFAAGSEGYASLLRWAEPFGRVVAFGVEGTGCYGAGLARHLRGHAMTVIEVNRPPRRGERRRLGKSDSIDAEQAARAVLAGGATAAPKSGEGTVEAIRLIKLARDTAVDGRSRTMNALKGILVTAPDSVRLPMSSLTTKKLIDACAALRGDGDLDDPEVAVRRVLAMLAGRWKALHAEVVGLKKDLEALTAAAAPNLVAAFGVGPDVAGEILVAIGDNSDRVRSEAAMAKLFGACPIPAGSGVTNGRHRLNRGGNRQANAALYRTIVVRMKYHAPTIAYVARRITEGLSKREIIRCLKRYLVRELFRLLPPPPAPSEH